MTSRECLLKAAVCNQMARNSPDRTNEAMLLECAKHWRNLAKTANPIERHDAGSS